MDWHAAQSAVGLISGKWDLVVMAGLVERALGYNELLRATGLDGKQLTRTLHRLRTAGLVDRIVHVSEPPARVCYRLTPRGRQLCTPLNELAEWWEHSFASAEVMSAALKG